MAEWSSGSLSGSCPGGHRFKSCLRNLAWQFNGENIMSGCHAPCDTDSNNSFFDGNEEMGVRFPPTQLIRISVLKLNMERWRNGRRGSYVQYIMFVMLTANLTAWGLLHCWFKSNSLQSRRQHKRPYKSIRRATWRGSSDGRAMI